MMRTVEKAIKTINELTKEEVQSSRSFQVGEGLDELISELLAGKEPRQELYKYLMSLDFEVIQALQTIMYVGRDFGEEEQVDNYYKLKRAELDARGWKTKSIEINQMVQKRPLGDYLMRGWAMVK